eukprot:15362983-Alexandrium_andersonii.AAC.1
MALTHSIGTRPACCDPAFLPPRAGRGSRQCCGSRRSGGRGVSGTSPGPSPAGVSSSSPSLPTGPPSPSSRL